MPKRSAGTPATTPDPLDVSRPGADGVEERGAFAFARCDKCGWQGAGRRSRERARKDLEHHLEDKPKHADHVAVEVAGDAATPAGS